MSERLACETEKDSSEEKRIEHYEKSKNEPFKFGLDRPTRFSFGQTLTPDKEREFNEIIAFLSPCKTALYDYQEQKPAKYTFKCLDGDIQVSEYGILKTDFYYKERVKHQDFTNLELNMFIWIMSKRKRAKTRKMEIFLITKKFQNLWLNISQMPCLGLCPNVMI